MFEFEDTPTNFILISVGVIFAMIALVVIYYVLIGYNSSSSSSSSSGRGSSGSPTATTAGSATSPTNPDSKFNGLPPGQLPSQAPPSGMAASSEAGTKQVFHIGDNLFTYDDAEAVCKAYGAELATYNQMVDAYKNGANWCSYGWTKNQLALYPIQYSFWNRLQEGSPEEAEACGVPGINGGYFENPNMQFGVNCYGVKRGPRTDEKVRDAYITDKERELRAKVAEFQKQLGQFKLMPFNEDKWGSCNV